MITDLDETVERVSLEVAKKFISEGVLTKDREPCENVPGFFKQRALHFVGSPSIEEVVRTVIKSLDD